MGIWFLEAINSTADVSVIRSSDNSEYADEGREEGRQEGETKLGTLMTKLRELGRVDDAFRAASDPTYREKLYAEFSIA